MFNKGKSWLSQGIRLDVVLDTFPIPKIPKKPKKSLDIQKRFALRIATSGENFCIGAKMRCFYC